MATTPNLNLNAVRIRHARDIRPAAIALRDFIDAATGLRTAVCHNIAVRHPMVDADGAVLATTVFGWTDNERDRWWRTPTLALESPIPIACRFESEPFWCNEQGVWAKVRNPALAELDLSKLLARGLVRAALVVPVHLPFGQIGVAALSPRSGEETDLSRAFERYGDLLGCYVRTFVSSYVLVTGQRLRIGPVGTISRREVECLRWAAAGKTDEETAIIIGRSRGTVRFHLRNASRKLHAVNRSQTVLRAAQLGYIFPST